jgi:hypothetical protein
MAAEKTTINKSDFIRQQPSTLSAAEVVDKAKAAGIAFDTGLVYNVRGRARSKRKAKTAIQTPRPPKGATAQPALVARPSASAHTNEEELLKIVAAEVGLGRAIELLQGERARVQAIIGA